MGRPNKIHSPEHLWELFSDYKSKVRTKFKEDYEDYKNEDFELIK